MPTNFHSNVAAGNTHTQALLGPNDAMGAETVWHKSQVLGGMQNTKYFVAHTVQLIAAGEMLEQSDEIKLAHTQTGSARHLLGSDNFRAFLRGSHPECDS